jgi:hypothetical protein
LQKIEKSGYKINDNKIFLKDEDIYEIIKIMYAQFQFIDESNYNLTEEQIKINVRHLTNKLLYFGFKKINIFDFDFIEPITDKEASLLLKYLDKSFNRIEFLKSLNLFRVKGIYTVPKREFDIMTKIFLKIAEHNKNDKDNLCTHLLIILSQTFYYEKDGQNIYLQHYLKNHEMFLELDILENYINSNIEKDIAKLKKAEEKSNVKVDDKAIIYGINNILNSHLIPFCDNMLEFGVSAENINKIIDPIMKNYQANDDLKTTINDIIKSKQEEMESKSKE